MATLPDITIPSDQYVSVNSLTGIAAGTAIEIQLKGVTWVYLQTSVAQPSNDSTDGSLLTNLSYSYGTALITAGDDEVWARSTELGRTSKLTVQEV